jgi:RimJ/RimL family protein N-acetyltransferase
MLPQTERSIQLLETSNYFIRIYELYQETHIVPTDVDFLYQINNHDPMYLIFYWLNLETHYPRFVEEEMDLETIRWMEEPDFVYFNLESETFKQFVRSLNL